MNAVAIGPLIFSSDRFAAILAIATFLISSEVLSRKVDVRFSAWAFITVMFFITAGRAGHIVIHAKSFMEEPWRALAIWQGGFHVISGVAAAVLFTLFCCRGHWRLVLWSALPANVAGYLAIVVLQLTDGVPAAPLPAGNSYATLTGVQLLPAELKGQPLVINLWATWCPPCRREMPMMADMAANNEAVEFVFVNQGEAKEAIDRYLTTQNIKLDTVILDSLGEFGRHYNAPGLPATLFIGSDGTLQSLHMGEISREILQSKIQKLE